MENIVFTHNNNQYYYEQNLNISFELIYVKW